MNFQISKERTNVQLCQNGSMPRYKGCSSHCSLMFSFSNVTFVWDDSTNTRSKTKYKTIIFVIIGLIGVGYAL